MTLRAARALVAKPSDSADRELFCMSHSSPAMWILSAFSTPHVVEARHWLAACANLFLHLPFPSWHRPDRLYSSLSHRGRGCIGLLLLSVSGASGIERLIVWLGSPHPSETSTNEIKSRVFLPHYSPVFM